MNLRALKCLVVLAECKHFSKAAEKCFMTQPALSMQIKNLEEQLGVQLLERTKKSVFLTEAGIKIAARASEVLQKIQEIEETAKTAADPYYGEFNLGIIPTLAPYLLPKIMPTLTKTYKKLNFYLIEEKTETLLKLLKDGQLDAIILALPINDQNFICEKLFKEDFELVVPNNHPFAKQKTIKLSDLHEQTLLLLEEGHCLREQALEICKNNLAKESENFRATSLETLRYMVASGTGMTLMPSLACHQKVPNATYVSFQNPKPYRTIGMVWRNTTSREKLMKEIATHIKNSI